MDIIAGLPTETTESFINTVDRLCELDPASITVHAVDRQHLLSDLIDSISNKFRLSINSLHTVTEDEIVTCTVNFSVHSYDELQTIVDTISDIPDVDEVSFRND